MTDESVKTEKSNAEFVMGTVVSAVSGRGITVRIDGQDSASAKAYKRLMTGSALNSGQRVLLIKMSGTYIVLGRIGQ